MASEADRYRSVVLTGGKGMLAWELTQQLRARGIVPVLTDREECDITDPAQVRQLFKDSRPTLLINCAAHTAVDRCEEEPELANAINGDAVGHLADLAREYHTRLIHFSTDFVFDGKSDRPYRADDPPNPISAYGRSKLIGEQKLQEASPPGWMIVRTAWLFGGHGNCFPKAILERARMGQCLSVVNDQFGCPTYAVDLAQAVLNLVDANASGMWHLTNRGETNWYEFAKTILSEFGLSIEVTAISTRQWVEMRPQQAPRPAYSVLSHAPYENLVGRPLRHWRDALRDYRTEVEKGS